MTERVFMVTVLQDGMHVANDLVRYDPADVPDDVAMIAAQGLVFCMNEPQYAEVDESTFVSVVEIPPNALVFAGKTILALAEEL